MIILHATVQVKPGQLQELTEALREYIPIAEKHGQKLVGSWRTLVGTVNEVTNIWAFDSLGHFAKARQSMAEDPDWQQASAKGQSFATNVTLKLLSPLTFTPLK